MKSTFSGIPWKKAMLWGIGIVLLYRTRGTIVHLAALALGALAFVLLLSPLCGRLEKHGISPAVSALISIALMLLTLAFCVGMLLPYLVSASRELLAAMTPVLADASAEIGVLLEQAGVVLQSDRSFPDWLLGSVVAMSTGLAHGGLWLFRQAGNVVLSLVTAFYLLRERKVFAGYALLMVPLRKRRSICTALISCRHAVFGYLGCVVKTGAFVASAMLVGLTLLGIRDAPLLALFMGVFEVFPYFGPLLASVPIILVALPEGIGCAAACASLIVIVQQLEGNVVSPILTASGTSVHPLASLIAVYAGGRLFGLFGVLLAIPAIVVLKSAAGTLAAVCEEEY